MIIKDFVQAAAMSSSARTLGNETGRQLLHNLNQYCRKVFVPSNTNQNQVSAGGRLGRCSSMACVVFELTARLGVISYILMKLAMEFISNKQIFHLLSAHHAKYLELVNSIIVLRTQMKEVQISIL